MKKIFVCNGTFLYMMLDDLSLLIFINLLLLIYDLQSKDWINTYYMLEDFLKAHRPPKVSSEMKCINKNMTWNTQDTNLNWYVPKANVVHTISGCYQHLRPLSHHTKGKSFDKSLEIGILPGL